MNILIISYEFPPVGTGTKKNVYNIGRELVRMGHKVGVLTIRFKGQARRETVDGIEVFRIPALRRRLHQSNPAEIATFSLSGLIYARGICDIFKPDITLAFFTIPSGVISLWLKKTRKIPFLTQLLGQDVPGWLPEVLKIHHALCKPLIRLIWQESERVVANSQGLAEMAKKTAGDKDILVVPNGVDPEIYCPVSRKKDDKKLCIFFI